MTSPRVQKSTSVRAKVAILRAAFGLTEHIAPRAAGRYATRLWLTVPPTPATDPQPDGGEPFEVRVGPGTVRGASHGDGPAVYLMHGWGGIGGQLSALIEPLRCNGFRVVLFDAPSHGRSDPGACGPGRTHGVEFAAALSAVTARFGPAHAVIAHSMGVLPTMLLRQDGLAVDRIVLIAPAQDVGGHLDRFAAQVGMGPRTRRAMDERIAELVGRPVADLDNRRLADSADSVPLLVVHDRGDRETSHAQSVALVERWAGPATMISTDGLGHRRILADPSVVGEVVQFVDAVVDRPRARVA